MQDRQDLERHRGGRDRQKGSLGDFLVAQEVIGNPEQEQDLHEQQGDGNGCRGVEPHPPPPTLPPVGCSVNRPMKKYTATKTANHLKATGGGRRKQTFGCNSATSRKK